MSLSTERSHWICKEGKTKECENEEVKSERTLTAGLCLALDCPLVDVLDLNNKENICFAHTDPLTVYLTTHTSICRFMQPSISDFMFSLGCEGLFRSLKWSAGGNESVLHQHCVKQ